jgi:hypothetical protein
MWTEHGGSGLGFSFESVNELDYADIKWLWKRARKQRTDEAAAMKKARRGS